MANNIMSVPCAYRLSLPEVWTQDRKRCREAGIPDEVLFAAKWEIALAAIDDLLAESLPPAPVTADAGDGMVTAVRDALTRRGLSYALAIPSETSLWPPGSQPFPPKRWSGQGRPPMRVRRTPRHRALSARELAQGLPLGSWKMVRWREGTRGTTRRCECAPRIGTKTCTNPGPRSGCWWTGPKGRKNRGSTGCPPYLNMSPWKTSCI